jgi:hypothetical protein
MWKAKGKPKPCKLLPLYKGEAILKARAIFESRRKLKQLILSPYTEPLFEG